MILSQGDLGITTLKSQDHFTFEFKGFYNGIFICILNIKGLLSVYFVLGVGNTEMNKPGLLPSKSSLFRGLVTFP